MVFSNSGPSWWGATALNGQGHLVGGVSAFDRSKVPYKCEYDVFVKRLDLTVILLLVTWHEVLGDGAWASMTFTGTRVNLTGTICRTGYQTTVDFYIDGQYMTRFENIPADRTLPMGISPSAHSASSDIYLLYTMADFDNLSPAEHTLKAVSVGADSLFVVDFIAYEPSAAIPVSSSAVSSASALPSSESPASGSSGIGSTISVINASVTVSASLSISSTSSSISGVTSSQPTASAPTSDPHPVVADMDVPASDSRIVYSPPEAWSLYGGARRATSCLDGTMGSSTANSSLAYNFTGKQLKLLGEYLF